jgi:lysophospholipase L1-like esterase
MSGKLKWYSIRWRTIFLGLLLALIIAGFAFYRMRFLLMPPSMGSGPAGPDVPSQPFENVWSERNVVLLGIGDSITNGFGAPKELGYFELLKTNNDEYHSGMKNKNLKTVLPNLTTRNLSRDYTVTQEHLDFQLPAVSLFDEDVFGIVVITTGGNDLIHDYGRTPQRDGAMYGCTYQQGTVWIENAKQRIKKLLDGLIEKFPGGCEIFLANIYDPTDGVSDPENAGLPPWPHGSKVLGLMNQKIAELCDEYENVHLIDIHTPFLGHGIHCRDFWSNHYHADDPHFWYYTNLEDPNPRGYDAIRRQFLLKMIDVLPNMIDN